MLVAAKVDAENPHRAAQIINEHPGVSHNYLRNHDFNLWFTIAVPPDSQARPRRHARGPEGARAAPSRSASCPTITMFKINMNLEMEGGTEALAAPAEAVQPMPREPVPIDDFDVALIRALQGPMEVRPDAYAPAAETARRPGRAAARALPRHGRAQAAAPGRGDPVPPPRRLLGERDGRLEGARRPDRGARPPDGRGARGLPLLPAARPIRDWPYSVFTMAHGRSKEECDAVLDGVAAVAGLGAPTARRSTPRPSSRRSACTTSRPTTPSGRRGTRLKRRALRTRSRELFERAPRAHAGRRQQPGARDARGRPRPDLHRRAARAPSSSTWTATATSTTSARGAR